MLYRMQLTYRSYFLNSNYQVISDKMFCQNIQVASKHHLPLLLFSYCLKLVYCCDIYCINLLGIKHKQEVLDITYSPKLTYLCRFYLYVLSKSWRWVRTEWVSVVTLHKQLLKGHSMIKASSFYGTNKWMSSYGAVLIP